MLFSSRSKGCFTGVESCWSPQECEKQKPPLSVHPSRRFFYRVAETKCPASPDFLAPLTTGGTGCWSRHSKIRPVFEKFCSWKFTRWRGLWYF